MTTEQALKIRTFCIAWISNVEAPKNNAYRSRLLHGIDELFPVDISTTNDPFNMLGCADWDNAEERGEEYTQPMCDRMSELIQHENIFGFGKKGIDAFRATIRIGIDLFINQSGGVVGYTIGDLKKAFGGTIPSDLVTLYGENMNALPDNEPIWL
ncbi:MAG TPA: hypothetical protein PLB89_05040 [Flavobacteriales bacterium]|nr:hypothetical protein [Flavobacteriales bacterium]